MQSLHLDVVGEAPFRVGEPVVLAAQCVEVKIGREGRGHGRERDAAPALRELLVQVILQQAVLPDLLELVVCSKKGFMRKMSTMDERFLF